MAALGRLFLFPASAARDADFFAAYGIETIVPTLLRMGLKRPGIGKEDGRETAKTGPVLTKPSLQKCSEALVRESAAL